MSIFGIIKRLLVNLENERDYGTSGIMPERVFEVSTNNWRAIKWLEDSNVLKLKRIVKIENSYVVFYDNLDPENEFFKYSGLRSRLTEDNSDYRYYSTGEVTDDYMHADESIYEHLAPEDSCCAELAVQAKGWETFEEFIEVFGDKYKDVLSEYIKEFVEQQTEPVQ